MSRYDNTLLLHLRSTPALTPAPAQVVASILGAVVWAIENPDRGIVSPDEIDFRRVLEIATPYLGTIVGTYTDWTPLHERGVLFDEVRQLQMAVLVARVFAAPDVCLALVLVLIVVVDDHE